MADEQRKQGGIGGANGTAGANPSGLVNYNYIKPDPISGSPLRKKIGEGATGAANIAEGFGKALYDLPSNSKMLAGAIGDKLKGAVGTAGAGLANMVAQSSIQGMSPPVQPYTSSNVIPAVKGIASNILASSPLAPNTSGSLSENDMSRMRQESLTGTGTTQPIPVGSTIIPQSLQATSYSPSTSPQSATREVAPTSLNTSSNIPTDSSPSTTNRQVIGGRDTITTPGGYMSARPGDFSNKSTDQSLNQLDRTIDYNARPETKAMFAREAQIVADRRPKVDPVADITNKLEEAIQNGDHTRMKYYNNQLGLASRSADSRYQADSSLENERAKLGGAANLKGMEEANKQTQTGIANQQKTMELLADPNRMDKEPLTGLALWHQGTGTSANTPLVKQLYGIGPEREAFSKAFEGGLGSYEKFLREHRFPDEDIKSALQTSGLKQ